jgi:hypothetical protein
VLGSRVAAEEHGTPGGRVAAEERGGVSRPSALGLDTLAALATRLPRLGEARPLTFAAPRADRGSLLAVECLPTVGVAAGFAKRAIAVWYGMTMTKYTIAANTTKAIRVVSSCPMWIPPGV